MSTSRRIFVACAAAAALIVAGACVSAPPIRHYLAETPATPVRVATPHGILTHAESERILAELRKRSPDTTILDRHAAIEQTLAGTPLSAGNRATLLQDGPATYRSMLEAIGQAKSFIHLEMYIFEGGAVGQEFADALAARRKAGVEVRVIYDGVGSMDTPKEFFDAMRREGIDVQAYNPISPGKVVEKGRALDHRDHRKLLVVDGRIAFVGGINISHVYGSAPRGPAGSKPSGASGGSSSGGEEKGAHGKKAEDSLPWRDTQVRIEGPVVAQFEKLFLQQWAKQRQEPPSEDPRYFPKVPEAGHELARAIAGNPDDGADASYIALVSAIDSAETSVRITNAYFVPAKDLRKALEAAAARGVRVELILPSQLDTWVALEAGRSYYDELLSAGVHIHEIEGRLLHAKTATIDGVWSTVGSTNLDYRSLDHNDELNLVVLGPDFASSMEQAFARDVERSRTITLADWRSRSLYERLREAVAHMTAYFL